MLNNTAVQGRLVRDPELKQTAGGIDVCKFTVAWSEKYKETEKNLFLDCTAFEGSTKMVANYFKKGKEIVVEGPPSDGQVGEGRPEAFKDKPSC